MVVAHRGCHAAAPDHGFNDTAPENSLAALQRCIAIGADVMETDVRRAADGTLVMLHDATVDRTTDGTGKLSELTLADLQKLRLRTDEGGAQAPLTDQRVVTLEQMLAASKGHILLNLDVKDAIYVQVVDAVTRAGMQHQVIVKAEAGIATPPLAAMQPFDRVYFFPILINAHGSADLAAIATAQTRNAHPVAFELPKMAAAQLPALAIGQGAPGAPDGELAVGRLHRRVRRRCRCRARPGQGLGPHAPRRHLHHPDRCAGSFAALSRDAGDALSAALPRCTQQACDGCALSPRSMTHGTAGTPPPL